MLNVLAWFQGSKSFSSMTKGYKIWWCVGSGRESFLSVFPRTEVDMKWGRAGPWDLPPVSFVTPPLLPGTRSCGLRPCPEQGAQRAVAHVKIMWDTASSFNSPREKANSFFSSKLSDRSRNKSQLGATKPLTGNTFWNFLINKDIKSWLERKTSALFPFFYAHDCLLFASSKAGFPLGSDRFSFNSE